MPFEEGQPALTNYLGLVPLKHVLKKQLFGGYYVRLYDYFTTLNYLYESGAVIGRARRDKLSILEKMLTAPGAIEGEAIKVLQDMAKERLEKFRNEVGKDPDTFNEFIFFREVESALGGMGLSLADCFEEYRRGNKKVMKIFDEKVPLGQVEHSIHNFGLEGIGFGSSFPQLTERMYRNSYEKYDMNKWSRAWAAGLDIPEKPEIISLEEREESLLQTVAAYTSEYYPELLDPLDLRNIIERLDIEEQIERFKQEESQR